MEIKVPEHNAGLYITHNEYKCYYQTIEEYIENEEWFEWVSDYEKEQALKKNSIWTIQWYPNTPIGFYAVAASELEIALEFANSYK